MAPKREAEEFFNRVRFRGEPVAHPGGIVRAGSARFTILTQRLIRMEWSEMGAFEDRGTFAFPTRRADPPAFEVDESGDALAIDTGPLQLRYLRDSGRFNSTNLSVSVAVDNESVRWTPGVRDSLNLRGTRRTVDGCAGDAALEPGILSRSGWALHDDSRSVVFGVDDGWVAPRPEHDLQDWYLFGYGHDYKAALAEYLRFGGGVPLIPRYVLGLWWSRYWAYSDQDFRDLVAEFENHEVPLDVLVIDMDWHLPDTWTGYTWDRALFPDPETFLRWVRSKGLRATFNLHPAQGVQSHEAMYEDFGEAMGADTGGGDPIPFRIADKRFAQAYFDLLHHPMEEEGVDFWWVDWQQGEASELRGLDPLPWLNHLHFSDSVRRGNRAMLYSRWGGIGNHRYHIGFSGDSFAVWSALQFQPYLTATASNVAYGWWSHDIGGHMGGATDPELYARWVQFGALSPCFRLHATKDPRAERRPWAFPDDAFQAARCAILLRYQLVPYVYSMARIASDTGVSLCRPMYYEYPHEEAAYAARYQYFFGDQMIAAPLVFPIDADTGLAATDVWVPPGTWIEYTTKETFEGPRWVRLVGDLQRVPVLVRSGAILPMSAGFETANAGRMASGSTDALRKDALAITVFPGEDGAFRLYEDDGLTEAYRSGAFEWTDIRSEMPDATKLEVRVAPPEGRCAALPAERSLEIRFVGVCRPDRVTIDGMPASEWTYDNSDLTARAFVPLRSRGRPLTVEVYAKRGISALGQGPSQSVIASDVRRLVGHAIGGEAVDIGAVLGSQGPGRLDAVARLGGPFVRFIDFVTPEEASRALGRVIVGAPVAVDGPYNVRVVFTLRGPDIEEQTIVSRTDMTDSLILDVPFSFEGDPRPVWWEAAVEVEWRGDVLSFSHASHPLFPTAYAWRCTVHAEGEESGAGQGVASDGSLGPPSRVFVHHVGTLDQSLVEPFVIDLKRVYQNRLTKGETLVAWLETTVTAPAALKAIIRFVGHGETTVELNGELVDEAMLDTPATDPAPFFQSTRTTEAVSLRKGANHLRIRPGRGIGLQGSFWSCGAAFADLNGRLIGGLEFKA